MLGAPAASSRAVFASIGPYPSRDPGSSLSPRSTRAGTVTLSLGRVWKYRSRIDPHPRGPDRPSRLSRALNVADLAGRRGCDPHGSG